MPHGKIFAPGDPHIRDALSVLIELLHGGYDVVEMLFRQPAPVNSETHHVRHLSLLLRSLQIVFHGVVPQFRHADAVASDELYGESLSRKGIVPALSVEELVHVDIYSVSSRGEHYALNSRVVEAFRQIILIRLP